MRQRWFSSRAIVLHLAILFWFPACLVAFWWQVNRAFDGNGLSYLYSVEWPIFAVVGVWGWWLLIHTDLDTVGRRAQQRLSAEKQPSPQEEPTGPRSIEQASGNEMVGNDETPMAGTAPRHEEEDETLAAYNAHLAELAARGPQTWRNR